MSASASFDEDDSASVYVPGVPTQEDEDIGKRIRKLRETRELTQEAFAKKLGKVTRGAVGNWELGQGIARKNLLLIAERLSASFEWLATGSGSMDFRDGASLPEIANALVGDKLPDGGQYIPLYGHAVGGVDGEFVLNGSEMGSILAPPHLSRERGAYAVTVVGESMEPRYYDSETVFVDPRKRVTKGDFVVVQVQMEEHGPPLAYIKRFVRHNSEELVLEQFNPPKQLRFPASKVVSVHYIVLGGKAT